MDITKEILVENGFKTLPHVEGCEFVYMNKTLQEGYTITLINAPELFNTDRKWLCQIDDEKFRSVGQVEINTLRHLELVCLLYEIDYNNVISCVKNPMTLEEDRDIKEMM